jgi:hypothetical protein
MVILTLGITVILAKLFPFGGQLVGFLLGGMYGPVFGKISPALFHIVILLANYIPAAIVAAIFVSKSQLKLRLPESIPGKTQVLIGLILIVAYLVPRLFASTIPGGGPAFVASMFGPYFIIPADILIVVGVVRALLELQPPLAVAPGQDSSDG